MGRKQYKRKNAEGSEDWHSRSRKPNLSQAEFKEGGGEPKDPNASPKRKVALIISYNGTGYCGLQVQPDVSTIEGTIFKAMHTAGGVSDENFSDVSKIGWSRCARTDKGVHAAANVISLKLVMKDNIVELINQQLPAPIRIMHLIRVAKKFNPKSAATSRAYLYLCPSFAFSSEYPELKAEEGEGEAKDRWARMQTRLAGYRISEENKTRLATLLKVYEGTKNYHNFTTTTDPANKSNFRYMMSFGIDAIVLHEGVEFVRLKVHGQSFMLHQIRKMVGLIIAIFQGTIPEALLTSGEIFTLSRKRVPTAPALGLLLDRPFFAGYDTKVKRDQQGDQLEKETFAEAFAVCDKNLEAFKENFIIKDILQTELTTFACVEFLEEIRKTDQHWGQTPVDVTYKAESEEVESEDDEEEEEERRRPPRKPKASNPPAAALPSSTEASHDATPNPPALPVSNEAPNAPTPLPPTENQEETNTAAT